MNYYGYGADLYVVERIPTRTKAMAVRTPPRPRSSNATSLMKIVQAFQEYYLEVSHSITK
jgi:hypothetical protein